MEYLALATEILFHRLLQIRSVHIDLIHLRELLTVHSFEESSDGDIGRTQQKRDFLVVELPLIEEVAGDGVCIVYLPSSGACIADGREGIIAEYDRIVLTKEIRMEEDSVLEIYLTQSLAVAILSKRYELASESHRPRIEPLWTEKKRREVSSERSGEHDIESLGSPTIQEHIVNEADFFGTGRRH